MTVPVYNTVGLLCADDAQSVDRGVGRRQVSVLTRAAGEAARRALTASQELTNAGGRSGTLSQKTFYFIFIF